MIGRLKLWAAAAGAAVLAIAAAYFRGRSEGAAGERTEQNERALDAARTRQKVEDDVAKTDRDGVDNLLSQWMRDQKR